MLATKARLLAGGAAAAALSAVLIAAGPAAVRRNIGIVHPDPILYVSAESPEPGIVLVAANAKHVNPFRAGTYWWCVDIRRKGSGRPELVSSHEYTDPSALWGGPRGVAVRPVLRERIELPPGRYSILVGLRENSPIWSADGEPLADSATVVADSATVDVR